MRGNNHHNSDFDIESIRRYGVISVIQFGSATVTCDVQKYNPMFVPRLADHKGRTLIATYKVGDKVSFFPQKATVPEKGCKFIAYKLTKVANNGSPEPLRKNVEGNVAFVNEIFGFVRFETSGKAYFHKDTALTNQSDNDLRKAFPLHSQIKFDVHAQPPKNGCEFRAENIRLVRKPIDPNEILQNLEDCHVNGDFEDGYHFESSQASSFFDRTKAKISNGRHSADAPPRFTKRPFPNSLSQMDYPTNFNNNVLKIEENSVTSSLENLSSVSGPGASKNKICSSSCSANSAFPPTDSHKLDVECQTDRLKEMVAIRKILEDDEISHLISQKYLTEFRVLMCSKLK